MNKKWRTSSKETDNFLWYGVRESLGDKRWPTRKTIGGLPTKAIAVESFLLFPPLYPPAHLLAYSVKFIRAMRLSTTCKQKWSKKLLYRLVIQIRFPIGGEYVTCHRRTVTTSQERLARDLVSTRKKDFVSPQRSCLGVKQCFLFHLIVCFHFFLWGYTTTEMGPIANNYRKMSLTRSVIQSFFYILIGWKTNNIYPNCNEKLGIDMFRKLNG